MGLEFDGVFLFWLQVYGDDEWSFGFCEQGTGVFSCPITKNPMYTYREKIVLGQTNLSNSKVNQILRELSREWPGFSYDLLSRNCNHFCDELCERLDVPKLPGIAICGLFIFLTKCKFRLLPVDYVVNRNGWLLLHELTFPYIV